MENLGGTHMSGRFSELAGKRILITGDTGFKGSWLALWLTELQAEVAGFALPPDSADAHFVQLGLADAIDHRDGDIRDPDALHKVFAEIEPEVVFHLAAQSLVRRSYDEPNLTFDTNVGGSANVLEAIRQCPSVKAAVYITSDKCYENKEWTWGYREDDRLGGNDPYSASKAAAELVFQSYVFSYFNDRPDFGIASARAGNVIGGGDWAADRIVPDCIRALMVDAPIVIRSPQATRPWQHVLEPLSGYLTLAERLLREPKRFGGAWNFGPLLDTVCTVKDLSQRIIGHWGNGTLQVRQSPNMPHEAQLLHLSIDKAQVELRWRPTWNLDQTVCETTGWYIKTEREGQSVGEISLAQIRKYMGEK